MVASSQIETLDNNGINEQVAYHWKDGEMHVVHYMVMILCYKATQHIIILTAWKNQIHK